jgi:hypothetical protein
MRGKLRDKRDTKQDRSKRELMGRRPARRDNRHVSVPQTEDDDDTYVLYEEGELTVEEAQQN